MVKYKSLPQYLGYLVGDDGSVWSKHGGWWGQRKDYRKLAPCLRSDGYFVVNLKTAEESSRVVFVHVLVLLAFVGPRPKGHECCHGNGIKTDNRLENLRWDLPQGNHADRLKHGVSNRGARNGMSRLKPDGVREIRRLIGDGVSHSKIGRKMGVSSSLVSMIGSGKRWGWLK